MSGEIRDWLACLPGTDPAAALLVGQALTALIGEGDRLGPPLVVSPRARPGRATCPRAWTAPIRTGWACCSSCAVMSLTRPP